MCMPYIWQSAGDMYLFVTCFVRGRGQSRKKQFSESNIVDSQASRDGDGPPESVRHPLAACTSIVWSIEVAVQHRRGQHWIVYSRRRRTAGDRTSPVADVCG